MRSEIFYMVLQNTFRISSFIKIKMRFDMKSSSNMSCLYSTELCMYKVNETPIFWKLWLI